jgi:acetyl esterase/lipase
MPPNRASNARRIRPQATPRTTLTKRIIMRLIIPILLLFSVLKLSPAFAKPPSKTNVPQAPADVIFERDIRYREGHDRWLLNVIHPKQASSEPRPAIVLVHGGGWTGGDHYRFSKMGFMLAQRGYVVMLPTYRMIKDGPFPACLHDVKNSIRWLRANAQKYNVDPKRIGAYGNSAGGTLALTVALTAGDKELEGDGTHLDSSSELQAVVCSGAVGDMRHPNHSKRAAAVYRNLAGALNRGIAESEVQAVMRRASPSSYIRKDVPPVLLIHGAKGTVVFIDSTDEFHKKMKSAGADIEYLRFEDGTHGVTGQKARTTTPAMLKFFGKHLGSDTE